MWTKYRFAFLLCVLFFTVSIQAQEKDPYRNTKIFFLRNKAILDASSLDSLNHLLQVLQKDKHSIVQLAAHADTTEKNTFLLSQQRADSLKKWLVQNGIPAKRLLAKGVGAKSPVYTKEQLKRFKRKERKIRRNENVHAVACIVEKDAYPFSLTLKVQLKNEKTELPIMGLPVWLSVDEENKMFEKLSDSTGACEFSLKYDRSYWMEIVTGGDYLNKNPFQIRTDVERVDSVVSVVIDLQSVTCKRDRLLPKILFAKNSYDLPKTPGDSDLLFIYNIMIENPEIVVELSAHSSMDELNKKQLSYRRAKVCADWLIQKGINPLRIFPVGYGADKLLYNNSFIKEIPNKDQESYHSQNRRMVVRVLRTNFVDPEHPEVQMKERRKVMLDEKKEVEYELEK